jgi:hypothetical protein
LRYILSSCPGVWWGCGVALAGQRDPGCVPFTVRHHVAFWVGMAGAAVGAACWTTVLLRMVQIHGRKASHSPTAAGVQSISRRGGDLNR